MTHNNEDIAAVNEVVDAKIAAGEQNPRSELPDMSRQLGQQVASEASSLCEQLGAELWQQVQQLRKEATDHTGQLRAEMVSLRERLRAESCDQAGQLRAEMVGLRKQHRADTSALGDDVGEELCVALDDLRVDLTEKETRANNKFDLVRSEIRDLRGDMQTSRGELRDVRELMGTDVKVAQHTNSKLINTLRRDLTECGALPS